MANNQGIKFHMGIYVEILVEIYTNHFFEKIVIWEYFSKYGICQNNPKKKFKFSYEAEQKAQKLE